MGFVGITVVLMPNSNRTICEERTPVMRLVMHMGALMEAGDLFDDKGLMPGGLAPLFRE